MVFCKNRLMFITGVVMASIVYSSHHQLLLVTALSTLYRRTYVTCFFILFFSLLALIYQNKQRNGLWVCYKQMGKLSQSFPKI